MRLTAAINGSDWVDRPLCSAYLAVVFECQVVRLRDATDGRRTFWWALGNLADGEQEVLGYWVKDSSDLATSGVPADLATRGVETVQFIVVRDESSPRYRLDGSLGGPGIAHRGAHSRSADRSAAASIAVASVVTTASILKASLSTRLRRRDFPSGGAVDDFLDQELQRYDRLLWAEVNGVPSGPRQADLALAGRIEP